MALILLVVVVFLGISVYERYTTERVMADRLETVETEYRDLRTREAKLREQVEYLQGERGIEEELRRNFDVAKPGEQVVVLTGEAEVVPTTTPVAREVVPWWQFWR